MAPSKWETLGDILSRQENQEYILGMLRTSPPHQEKISSDAAKIIRHSSSGDYEIWAKEVWAKSTEYLDKLCSDKLTERQVDFYRGSLSATLDLLRMAERTRIFYATLKSQENGKVLK